MIRLALNFFVFWTAALTPTRILLFTFAIALLPGAVRAAVEDEEPVPVGVGNPSAQPALPRPTTQWRGWNAEAFAEAKQRNLPILLCIQSAYSHGGMELERKWPSDPASLQLIEKWFVPIRVDALSRPDLEQRHSLALRALGGQAGLPLVMFLTPEGQVLAGGPFNSMDDDFVGKAPGLLTTIRQVAQAWRDQREDMLRTGAAGEEALRAEQYPWTRDPAAKTEPAGQGQPAPDLLARAAERMRMALDRRYGGFAGGMEVPQVPMPGLLEICILHHTREGPPEQGEARASSLAACQLTLGAMLRGGIYDRMGGGFHRQTLDRAWQQPCFEKLTATNLELLVLLIHAWQATGDASYEGAARQTFAWLTETMYDPELGGFFASQAADAGPGDDGGYYTWSVKELEAALPDNRHCELVQQFYGIGERGDQPETAPRRSVFREKRAWIEVLKKFPEGTELLAQAWPRLRAARQRRPAPALDKTLLLDVNARASSACFLYADAFQNSAARQLGLRLLDRLLIFGVDPQWGAAHVLPGTPQETGVYLGWASDEAALALACQDAFLASGQKKYLEDARESLTRLEARFRDPQDGLFFDRADLPGLPAFGRQAARRKSYEEAPLPAPLALGLQAELRQALLENQPRFAQNAAQGLKTLTLDAAGNPLPSTQALDRLAGLAPGLLHAWDLQQHGAVRLVIEGATNDPAVQDFGQEVGKIYLPHKLLLHCAPGQAAALAGVPAEANPDNTARAWIMLPGQPAQKFQDPESFRRALEKL